METLELILLQEGLGELHLNIAQLQMEEHIVEEMEEIYCREVQVGVVQVVLL
jgi:hypothetical protein